MLRRKKAASELSLGEIQPHELDVARDRCHREVQKEVIQDKDYEQTKKSMSLFLDEKGVLRFRGRIQSSPISYDSKFPILIPRKSWLATLVIQDAHRKVMHNGVRETIERLHRRRYQNIDCQMISRFRE